MSEKINKSYTSYKKDIVRINNKERQNIKQIYDYEDAEQLVVDFLTENKILNMEAQINEIGINRNLTKDDLKKEKEKIRRMVVDCIMQKNITVRGYSGDKIETFINEMVSEYAGYSVLEEAFNDPDVDDIFCLAYNKIYVEKNGRNERYQISFKNKTHYKDVIERFLRKAGKEINVGDSKIVDFELYGDRGCATSPAVTPKDYTMTLRKHREDHIQLDDLLYQEVLNEEISDFFGLTIDGESNLIYAGITGTGKTTTIRSLIDFYVTRNKKRMLVCEDTQELFPKNEHTMEMISCRSDDKKADVPLYKLIITALRLKPKYIIVGEVRAEEAQAAVEAMETGHSTIFTMHAGKPINAIDRLVSKYLMMMPNLSTDVVERIIGEAVDFIAIQDHIPDIGRKVSVITEVTFDSKEKTIKLQDLMRYDFDLEDWIWLKRIDPEKCRNLMRRGCSKERVKAWMDTGNPEIEEQALKELNEKYYKEKEQRKILYEKEHNEKIERKKMERMNNQNNSISKEEKRLLMDEKLREKELEEMLLKTEMIEKLDRQSNFEKE